MRHPYPLFTLTQALSLIGQSNPVTGRRSPSKIRPLESGAFLKRRPIIQKRIKNSCPGRVAAGLTKRRSRSVMQNGYEREFTCVYGAVSSLEGAFDYRICNKVNTEEVGIFLEQISVKYPENFILMVLDEASSHKAKALPVPLNIGLITLLPYSPQLNPQENVWDEVREKKFRTGSIPPWKPSGNSCASALPNWPTPLRR